VHVEISFDPAKRDWTLRQRGLDFLDAVHIFGNPEITLADDRREYPEERYLTYGLLNDRLHVVVWTATASGRRVISMRKCNEREQRRFRQRLD
jgi:uncharacterized protein